MHEGVDGTSVDPTCDAGNLVRLVRWRPLPSGDLIQCGPALTEEAIRERDSESVPEPCSKEFN